MTAAPPGGPADPAESSDGSAGDPLAADRSAGDPPAADGSAGDPPAADRAAGDPRAADRSSVDPLAADPLAAELCRELGEAILAVGHGGPGGEPAAAGAEPYSAGAETRSGGAELCVLVRRADVARVAAVLRSRFRYTLLVDLCAVDYPEREERFEVVYHLYSFRENRRIRVKVRAGEGLPVPSVTGVWPGAGWPEREAHDLFGIDFSGHPELTRILLWDGFAGHPLRKDFPLAGIDTGAALHPDPGAGDDER